MIKEIREVFCSKLAQLFR